MADSLTVMEFLNRFLLFLALVSAMGSGIEALNSLKEHKTSTNELDAVVTDDGDETDSDSEEEKVDIQIHLTG